MGLSLAEKVLALLAALSDRWLGSHLGQRLLTRYDMRIAGLKQELAEIETARRQLDLSSQALVTSTCAVLLATLYPSPQASILFEPDDENQDLLQTAINVLVKPGLATIRDHPRPDDRFAYELFLHWGKICDHLQEASQQIESPELATHVRQNVARIQAVLGDQAGSSLRPM